MACFTTWTVLPHQPIEKLSENLWCVRGVLPDLKTERKMTVIKGQDGSVFIHNAIALEEPFMQELEAFGRPSYIVVPGGFHRQDARIWKDRYPSLQVVAPEGARAKVEEIVPVDTTSPDFEDPRVAFVTVPGVDGHEAALVVNTDRGTTLVVNDIVGNIHHAHGAGGWILRAAGFAGAEPQVPRVVKKMIVEDEHALIDQLERWSDMPCLSRIIVSHGTPIEDNPRRTLRSLARSLS